MAFWSRKKTRPEEMPDDEPEIDEDSFVVGQHGSQSFSFVDLVKVYGELYNETMKTGEVPTIGFTSSYREITKLFDLLGKPFVFVRKDVVSKIMIIEEIYNKDTQHNTTIQKMIKHEVDTGTTNTPDLRSGSRTVLRLFRALSFISLLLKTLITERQLDLGSVVTKSYNATLSPFHTWMVRKLVGLSTYALPTRETFVQTIGLPADERGQEELVNKLILYVETVISKIKDSYVMFKLSNLP